jgi:CHASE3 domain sensor protein
MEYVLIIFGSIVGLVLGCVGISAWKAVELQKRKGMSEQEVQAVIQRLDRLEAEVSEVRDLLSDFVIREHDEQKFRRLEAEVEEQKVRLSR